MDALAAVIAHEELASSDPAFCLSFLAHSMLFVNNVARNASDEQCRKYLPGACSGEKICGMGMSEPSVGTDVLGMRTTAKKSECGKYYILNGTKYVHTSVATTRVNRRSNVVISLVCLIAGCGSPTAR